MQPNLRRQVVMCGLIAVCLWLSTEPAAAQASIIDPIGQQFFSWINSFEIDFFPFLVTLGILVAIGIGCLVSIKLGAFAFAAVVASAVAWGTRTGVISLGS